MNGKSEKYNSEIKKNFLLDRNNNVLLSFLDPAISNRGFVRSLFLV